MFNYLYKESLVSDMMLFLLRYIITNYDILMMDFFETWLVRA